MIWDLFDKLDDIIYKSVETFCEWTKEPLKRWEHDREQQAERNCVENEIYRQQQEMQLAQWDAEKRMELEQAQARANIELDNLAADSQLARNTAMVEAIKQYQVDLARVTQEIIQSIGSMNLQLRAEANDMLLAKTRDYKALQDEAVEKADKRLLEIKERYGSNERVRIKMEDAVISQMTSVIEHADTFMEELSADLRKINDTIQQLTDKGMDNINRITGAMQIPQAITEAAANQKLLMIEPARSLK